MKQSEIKDAMLIFLNNNSEYVQDNDMYKIGFFTKEKGLYSGVCQTKGKVYGFVIDFSNKSFFIEGITGKHLVENSKNLSTIFPEDTLRYGSNVSDTLKKLYRIGYMLGDYNVNISYGGGHEDNNIGRGILRAIKKYPIAEQLAAMPWSFSSSDTMHDLISHLTDEQKKRNVNSLKDIVNLHGKHFKLFLNADSVYEASRIFENLDDKAISTIEQCNDITAQVDKERGYHDSERYGHEISHYMNYSYQREKLQRIKDSSKYKNVKIDFTSMIKYLYFSAYHQQALDFTEAFNILLDYWNFMPDNNKGISKYPRYLKTAHDVASKNYYIIKDFSKEVGVYKNYKEHDKLEGVCQDTAFIVAMLPEEIGNEANQQGNCVAGYIDSVANNETTIMFMRDVDNLEKSSVTFEIKEGRLVQAYATYDRPLDEKQSSKLLGYCKLLDIPVNGYLALDYDAKPNQYKKLKELSGFHDLNKAHDIEDSYQEKSNKLNNMLKENKALTKTA